MTGDELRLRLAGEGPPLLLDAAMGTELARLGSDTSAPLWSARALVDRPDLVTAVHADHAAAGADVLTADTFRTHRRNLEQAGLPRAAGARSKELAVRAVARAREGARAGALLSGAQRPVLVAGSLAPLEDCYRPDLVPDDTALHAEHREQATALAEAGVDLILIETMNTVRELAAAARAASETGLAVVASMVTDGSGRLLSGETIEEAANALLSLPAPPDVIGINCVPARRIGTELARLSAAAPGTPLTAYANTGRALDEAKGLFTEPIDPYEYAALARRWLATGVRIVGGCCGTTAAHLRALRVLIDERGSTENTRGSSSRAAPDG